MSRDCILPSSSSRHLLVLLCFVSLLGWAEVSGDSLCTSTLQIPPNYQQISSKSDNGNIHLRSLSPWSWNTTFVHNRIPEMVSEADCSSSYCSSPNGPPSVDERLNSVPIYQEILVLKKHMSDSTCFTVSFLHVAVGCTCVWAKTSAK
uniref:Uncharacterized protein n=1 Tax=Denticeps clupeoides TaxID=299321 RepID=A0AAY4A474_9TELE